MSNQALPIYQQIILDISAPPVLAAIWWFQSRGSANIIQGGEPSERTKLRQSRGFWIVLGALYLLMFGATAYFNLVD
jgi:hypothetical protein